MRSSLSASPQIWASGPCQPGPLAPMPEILALAAFRYALGRMTYQVPTCVSLLLEDWDSLSDQTLGQILSETKSAISANKAGTRTDADGWGLLIARGRSSVIPPHPYRMPVSSRDRQTAALNTLRRAMVADRAEALEILEALDQVLPALEPWALDLLRKDIRTDIRLVTDAVVAVAIVNLGARTA